jgi:hypothetical protein
MDMDIQGVLPTESLMLVMEYSGISAPSKKSTDFIIK